MISKNKAYNKKMVKRKTVSIVFYGIIFLITTLAYYFVNNSNAQNVIKLESFIMDVEGKIEQTSYEVKVAEKDDKYIIKLPFIQNQFQVLEYNLVSEEDYIKIEDFYGIKHEDIKSDESVIKKDLDNNVGKKLEIDKTIQNVIENESKVVEEKENNTTDGSVINNEINSDISDSNIKQEEKIVETSIADDEPKAEEAKDENNDEKLVEETKTEEQKEENKIEEDTANKEEKPAENDENKAPDAKASDEKKTFATIEELLKEINGTKIEPEEEFELNKEQVDGKKLFLIVKYDKIEENGQELYNKTISTMTENHNIIISGFMPSKADIKVNDVSTSEVEEKINKEVKEEVKLKVAYDIKIIVDGKEYEPYEFDEAVNVEIIDKDYKDINIWHIVEGKGIEKIETTRNGNSVEFNTTSFSIYGVEEVTREDTKTDEEENTITNEVSNEIANNTTNTLTNNTTNDIANNVTTDEVQKGETNAQKGGPLRAPAPNIPDSTLTINDYTSDYYYYKGMNYTSTVAGTYTPTYTDSNLIQLTLNYHGFASGETDPEKKGRISLTETEDIVQNIRCVPVTNGNITVELMENPFMDKPTGYGFGGWTASSGTVSQNSQTLTYTLTTSVSGNTIINLYAIWTPAKVVYVNQTDGNDNLNDGLTESTPFGSWGKACETLYGTSTDRTDREKNIIVVTGPLDSSINFTKTVTGETRPVGTTTYTRSTSISSGSTYIIATGNGAGSYALAVGSGTSVTREQLSSTVEPSQNTQWTITQSGNGYTIRDQQGRYLAYSGGLYLSNSSSTWTFSSNRFRNGNRYLRYTNNAWTATNNTSGATIYLLSYNFTQTGTTVINTPDTSFSNNSYYSDSRNLALTVTSLYNHTDYRSNARITLPENSNGDWNVYNAFQMDFINIYTGGYTSNSGGDTFTDSYAFLYGNSKNVRIGRGMQASNNATFANVIGASQGTGDQNNSNNAYKMIIESGRYSEIIGFNYTGTRNYYGTVYLTLGNDIDRNSNNNNELLVYYASTINIGGGINGKPNVNDMAFLINVKSGSIGTPYFDANGKSNQNSAYSGIYVGGWGTSNTTNRDISDRYCIVEGGKLSNIVGGLKTVDQTPVKTRIFVKGGELYNIVGGRRSYPYIW